jgi:hypothetical protein
MGRPRHARRPPGRSCDVKSDDRDGTHEDTAQGSEYESKPLGSIEPGHNTATVWSRGRCYRWDTPLTGHAPLHQDRSRRRGPRAPLVRPGDVFPWSRRDNPQGAGDQRTHHASPLSRNGSVVDRLRPLMRLADAPRSGTRSNPGSRLHQESRASRAADGSLPGETTFSLRQGVCCSLDSGVFPGRDRAPRRRPVSGRHRRC